MYSSTTKVYGRKLTFTCVKFEIPRRKQMESSMFDFPLPFRPVIALNWGSNPEMVVRVAYDLKPSITTCLMYILNRFRRRSVCTKQWKKHRFVNGARPLILPAETFPEALAIHIYPDYPSRHAQGCRIRGPVSRKVSVTYRAQSHILKSKFKE